MFQLNATDGRPRVQIDRLPRVTGGAEVMLQTFEDGKIMSSLGLERGEAIAIGRALWDAAEFSEDEADIAEEGWIQTHPEPPAE